MGLSGPTSKVSRMSLGQVAFLILLQSWNIVTRHSRVAPWSQITIPGLEFILGLGFLFLYVHKPLGLMGSLVFFILISSVIVNAIFAFILLVIVLVHRHCDLFVHHDEIKC